MIDATSQLTAFIRAEFAAQARNRAPARKSGGPIVANGSGETPASEAEGGSVHDRSIQKLVALRVRALSPDDPQRQRKAFKIFLESVLIQELGRARVDQRRFDEMVDEVLRRMEADETLKSAVQDAGALLLAEARPAGPQGG